MYGRHSSTSSTSSTSPAASAACRCHPPSSSSVRWTRSRWRTRKTSGTKGNRADSIAAHFHADGSGQRSRWRTFDGFRRFSKSSTTGASPGRSPTCGSSSGSSTPSCRSSAPDSTLYCSTCPGCPETTCSDGATPGRNLRGWSDELETPCTGSTAAVPAILCFRAAETASSTGTTVRACLTPICPSKGGNRCSPGTEKFSLDTIFAGSPAATDKGAYNPDSSSSHAENWWSSTCAFGIGTTVRICQASSPGSRRDRHHGTDGESDGSTVLPGSLRADIEGDGDTVLRGSLRTDGENDGSP